MSATQAAEGMVVFEWALELDAREPEARDVAERIREAGGQAEVVSPPAGIAPLAIPFIVFGAVAAVGLGEQVWEWWKNRNKHGLLIQVEKDGKVDIKEIDIPYGQVIVLAPDGTKVEHKDVSKDKLQQLIDAATKAVTGAAGNGSGDASSGGNTGGSQPGGSSTAPASPGSAAS